MANNKVELADGTVLMDITDTTAVPSDVVSGKEFYGANGVKSTGSATYAGSPSAGGPATVTNGVHIAQVDSTSTSKAFTAQIPGITSYYDGLHILLYNGVVTSASGFTININGLGAYGAYNNMTLGNAVTPTDPTRETTIFNINYAMEFIFYTNIGGDGTSGWICYRGYDANTNTVGYQLRTNSTVRKTKDKFRYYKVLFSSPDNTHWIPAASATDNSATSAKTVNQRPINPFGEIVYCSSTTSYAAEADVTATGVWQEYTFTLGYSFNRTGAALSLTTRTPVYIKCAPQSDGSAIIDSTTPYVQALPSTDDGKIYIFLGIAYSATQVELTMNHPVFYYKNGAIRLWTNAPSVDTSSFLTQTDEKVWFRVGDISDSQSESGCISAIVNSSGNPATYEEVYGAYKKIKDVIVYSSAGISNQEITTATIGKIAYINEYAQSISVTWYDGLNLGCMEFREGDAESEHSGVLVLTNSYQTALGENLDLTTMLTEESYIKNVQIMDDGGETYIYDSYYGNLDYYTFAGIVDKSKGYDIQYGNYVCSLASFDYSNQIIVIDYIDTTNGKKRLHELTFEEDSSYGVLTKQSETITIIPTKTSELTNDSGYITSAPVTSVNGQTGAVSIPALPTVSSSDNGKFLRVVSGVWAAATVSNASGVSF